MMLLNGDVNCLSVKQAQDYYFFERTHAHLDDVKLYFIFLNFAIYANALLNLLEILWLVSISAF